MFKAIFSKINSVREILFILLAVVVVVATVVFSNMLAQKIEEQEEIQAVLWAKAITKRAEILKKSNIIFEKLSNEERKKVEINAKATEYILSESDGEKISFYLDILKLNDQIPIVSTDEKFKVQDFRNIVDKRIVKGILLDSTNFPEFFQYEPIEVSFSDKKNYIFYRESNLFNMLGEIIDQSSNQFFEEIKNNPSMIPTVILDEDKNLIHYGNIPDKTLQDSSELNLCVADIVENGSVIPLDFYDSNNALYYKHSNISSYVKWFPLILYTTLGIFLLIAFFAINKARNFEKNQIWVGMSKETAHQLGTPISSLSAWTALLKDDYSLSGKQSEVVDEMQNDIERLTKIADRFSKIGSKPKLEKTDIFPILENSYTYFSTRASKKIDFKLVQETEPLFTNANRVLFEWVLENMIKNSFDSIVENGVVEMRSSATNNKIIVEIADNGKGMSPNIAKQIFTPGFTTKKRGWGLGLSLCKRIIEDYFGGKIFVKTSKIDIGTTMRVELARI